MALAASALIQSLVGGAGSGEVALLGIGAGLLLDLGLKQARLLRRRRGPSPPVALPEEGTPLRQGKNGELAQPRENSTVRSAGFPMAVAVLGVALPHLAHAFSELLSLAVIFFRTGLGAYGGGFAIIPSLNSQAAAEHLLTERQFADAVAVGKLTPGPVLLLATFIGYVKMGLTGAAVSTVDIFAEPFLLMVTLAASLERIKSSPWVRSALSGLTPSVVGLMIAAGLSLSGSIRSGISAAIAAAVALTLIRFEHVNPVVLLALGGVVRMVYRLATGT